MRDTQLQTDRQEYPQFVKTNFQKKKKKMKKKTKNKKGTFHSLATL
jgi:hypothetical protein